MGCGACSRRKIEEEKPLESDELDFPRKIWDRNFTKPVHKDYKISLCTTCMGRSHDLKLTFIKNFEDNLDYPNIEFVLLNYNSPDDFEEWAKDVLPPYIATGKVVYYKTTEPKFYSMSHSRNVAFKLATGDIVNNVDADSYVKAGFASYLNKQANQQPSKAIFTKGKKMMRGRLGFYRSEFIWELGGYDEKLTGYGHDDHDLRDRAWAMGYEMMWYGSDFHESISTTGKERTDNMENRNWKQTEDNNRIISATNLKNKVYTANAGTHWGKALVTRNFGSVTFQI